MGDDDSYSKSVGRWSVFYYGSGHMLNDITSACWFTYLLLFLTDIGLSPRYFLYLVTPTAWDVSLHRLWVTSHCRSFLSLGTHPMSPFHWFFDYHWLLHRHELRDYFAILSGDHSHIWYEGKIFVFSCRMSYVKIFVSFKTSCYRYFTLHG